MNKIRKEKEEERKRADQRNIEQQRARQKKSEERSQRERARNVEGSVRKEFFDQFFDAFVQVNSIPQKTRQQNEFIRGSEEKAYLQ